MKPDSTPRFETRFRETLETLQAILNQDPEKVSLLIRHSKRYFSDDPANEPFMCLTETGKQMAARFGAALPAGPVPVFFSSFFGRCIETACFIEKSYTAAHGISCENNQVDSMLAPFYIRDIKRTVEMIMDMGAEAFIDKWLDNQTDRSVIDDPRKTGAAVCAMMIERLQNLQENRMAMCVTHDWNIYPVRKFVLGPVAGTSKDVGYLDGIIFYQQKGRLYATGNPFQPVELKDPPF